MVHDGAAPRPTIGERPGAAPYPGAMTSPDPSPAPGLQRIAVLSDVHGNVTAYRAVLADIAARGITRVLNLGDVAGKGPRGSEAVALTRRHCEAVVRGNWEAYLTGDGEAFSEGQAWWRAELADEDRAWLGALPGVIDLVLSGRRIRLLHASATDEFTRLPFHHGPEQFAMMFEPTPFTADAVVLGERGDYAARGQAPTLVGYGDIHDAYLETEDSRTLVNVGSVGNPLDEPLACYLILEGVPDSEQEAPFSLQFVRLPYDVEAEIAVAEGLGMPETEPYARELRTAIYRGRPAPGE